MTESVLAQYPPLSFVTLKGFSTTPVIVQLNIDNRFLVLSNHYLLSPIVAIPQLIDAFVGTQADIIKRNAAVYKQLIEKIHALESDNPDGRHKTNDPLLAIRAFTYLGQQVDLQDSAITEVSEALLISALNHAVDQDELIKDTYRNMVEAYSRAKQVE